MATTKKPNEKGSQSKIAEKLDSSNRKGSDSKNPEQLSSAGDLAKDKVEETKVESPRDDSGEPEKVEKKETKKVKAKEIPKKDVAIANGFSLKISPKQSKYICKLLRGKSPEGAVARLQAVIDEKRPVPMAALEVGHKKGKGLAGGKFPKNACRGIMEIVKQAGANAVVAGIESPVITIARSDRASAPYRKAGRKAKRCHIHIELREKSKLIGKKTKGGKK